MFHVGPDIHSTHISICVINETGQLVHRSRVRTIKDMLGVLEGATAEVAITFTASHTGTTEHTTSRKET
jgi:hypothetical protein